MNQQLIALSLLESTVTLYPTDATGAPILASPIWSGVTVENLTIKERWLKTETKPTGAPYPRKHPLIQQYELSLGRVWSLQLPTSDGGLIITPQRYVLDIVWQDEDSNDWHRETFYNVTISDRSKTSRDIESGFTDEQIFEAEYMAPPTGGDGSIPIPAISATLPLVVRYVPVGGSSLGGVDLYAYDPTAHTFTEAVSGISTGRATLAYSGSAGTQAFAITFSGAGSPSLAISSAGVLTATAVNQGAPSSAETPRLEFYYGTQRLASLTSAGTLWAPAFTNASPTAGAGIFALYGGGVIRVTIAGSGVVAGVFSES